MFTKSKFKKKKKYIKKLNYLQKIISQLRSATLFALSILLTSA